MRMPLPEPLRRRLRAVPQWHAVGVAQPQPLIDMRLCVAADSHPVDDRLVVASLRPLTLALALEGLPESVWRAGKAQLQMHDRTARRCVGALTLLRVDDGREFGCRLAFFHVTGEQQQCLNWPQRSWNRWLQDRAMRTPAKPGNFSMPPATVHQMMVFYMCPRPVVAVSVQHDAHRNLFPMDLIGPLGADRFSLALRSTSPSIAAMIASRSIAIADVPAAEVDTAYALGAHHRQSLTDWADAPLAFERSTRFQLPVPAFALRVRELEVQTCETVGSHHLFITRIVSDQPRRAGPQLCHVPGIYQRFRERLGAPLAAAHPG